MEHYDPKGNLRFWPLESMARFGQNPFGENIWRVVHAPSRRSLVHGHGRKPKWLPTYPQAGNAWVLEKWLSAYEFTKCTAEVWNMSMTLLGPYPSRGEYELAHVFPDFNVNPEKIITWIEAGKRYSANENANSLKQDMERENEAGVKYRKDVIMNALPAFGNAPMAGYGGGRGIKTQPDAYSANDFGWRPSGARPKDPMRGIHTPMVRPSSKRVDVSQLIEA